MPKSTRILAVCAALLLLAACGSAPVVGDDIPAAPTMQSGQALLPDWEHIPKNEITEEDESPAGTPGQPAEKPEQKSDDKTDGKTENKTENKSDKTDGKTDTKNDNKSDKTDTKPDNKTDNKTENKPDPKPEQPVKQPDKTVNVFRMQARRRFIH